MSNRPKVVDLFAGAGGFSLGFEQAGFDVVAAVEMDPVHAAIHHYNFPYTAMLPRSVTDISGSDIAAAASLETEEIDVVIGGAPCQGFSLIGQRALDDPRNQLVRHFLRLVTEIRPSYFVFENVKGLTVGRHSRFLWELIEELSDLDFEVLLPWRVLNAVDYGVPQNRERLILIGARKGVALPEYPAPSSHEVVGSLPFCEKSRRVTCQEALGDLPDAESFSELLESDEVEADYCSTNSDYSRQMRCASDAAWHWGYRRVWDSGLLTSSMRTRHTEISRRRFQQTEPGTVEPISRFFRLAADGVSNTLRAGTDSARGAFTSPRPIHYEFARCVTVREMARLHGYPDWFRFHSTKWHGARQIGNSVPPPLARSVAEVIRTAMGVAPEAPAEIHELGSDCLLRKSVSEAADYWGIQNPIGRRDRKSGAKKRSQEEIEAQRTARSEVAST